MLDEAAILSAPTIFVLIYGWVFWIESEMSDYYKFRRRQIMAIATLLFPVTALVSIPVAMLIVVMTAWRLVLIAIGRE